MNCGTFIRELKMNAVATCCSPSHSSSEWICVVWPLPTSPLNGTKPLRLSIQHDTQTSAPITCRGRNREPGIGEAWGIGQVRRVEQSHLLTLLATLHVGLHGGLTLLGQQIVVEPLRRVVVARQ